MFGFFFFSLSPLLALLPLVFVALGLFIPSNLFVCMFFLPLIVFGSSAFFCEREGRNAINACESVEAMLDDGH